MSLIPFRLLTGFLLILACSQSVYPEDTLTVKTNYYPVVGLTLPEIQQSIRQTRPWKDKPGLAGFTAWRIDWRFRLAPSEGKCVCRSFTTQTSITITLPRWTSSDQADPAVRKAWRRYSEALADHEGGHAKLALAAVKEIHKQVSEIEPQPACPSLKAMIDGVGLKVLEDFRKQEADFDRRTSHGTKQGAFLPRTPPAE